MIKDLKEFRDNELKKLDEVYEDNKRALELAVQAYKKIHHVISDSKFRDIYTSLDFYNSGRGDLTIVVTNKVDLEDWKDFLAEIEMALGIGFNRRLNGDTFGATLKEHIEELLGIEVIAKAGDLGNCKITWEEKKYKVAVYDEKCLGGEPE
ncbi:MAG: hypothetical protein ACOC5G_04065 [Acidobacteriota bacterium]